MKSLICSIIVWFIFFGEFEAIAQESPLERKVDLQVVNTSLQQTLFLLAEEGKFSIAYNSDLIPVDSLITYHAVEQKVKFVLDDLLRPGIGYSAFGQHVILKIEEPDIKSKPIFSVSGLVYNAYTGQVIPDATIYSNVKLKSDLTDEDGTCDLELKKREPIQQITISKIGYRDTTLEVRLSEIYNLNIKLIPEQLDVPELETVERFRFVNFFTKKNQRINAINVRDTLTRIGQFSLLPIVGTNWKMSGALTNMISVNLIGG